MRYLFHGITEVQEKAIHELEKDFCLQLELSEEGCEVDVKKQESGIRLVVSEDRASLFYNKEAEFFRGLSLLAEARQSLFAGETRIIEENPAFEDLCYMQDNSRNGVSNLSSVKKLIRQMALMGYTSFQLYTEDTYEITEYPYFGYMRGRFSKNELKEIHEYALNFGIEVVPCIQTLAHLNAIFQWKTFGDIHDTEDILLTGEEKTYELIETMVKTCAECFTSKRINIGMDEAEMLGRGKFLEKNGYQERLSIMLSHLKRVVEICEKYGYAPMMWSDMFFKILSGGGYHSDDFKVSDEVRSMIPQNVELVYWDYYTRNREKYDTMIERHKLMSDNISFAGGAWRWNGFAPLCRHSVMASRLALESCVAHGIKRVMVTGWGDNGSECSTFVVHSVLQLYAEYCYGRNTEDEQISRRLKTCTGMNFGDFMELDSLNLTPDNPSPGRVSVGPAKYLFYQDILMGLFDTHVDEETYPAHFNACKSRLAEAGERAGEYAYIFENLAALAHVLELKSTMGIRAKRAYDCNNKAELKAVARDCEELLYRIDIFHKTLFKQWRIENKPFGMDVLDLRIGGLKERVKRAESTIDDYLKGIIPEIEELAQERLLLDERENPGFRTLPLYHNNWKDMVSACVI